MHPRDTRTGLHGLLSLDQQVEQRISKTNRTYFLNEQLKSIKKELGMEKDDKDALAQKFRERVRRVLRRVVEGVCRPASADVQCRRGRLCR
jgi:ATP-dependent Lon protease